MSLRLLIDYCVSRKLKLYIVYVDFSKACDRLPRAELLRIMRRLGCGAVTLAVIRSTCMYRVSYGVLGAIIVTATVGIRILFEFCNSSGIVINEAKTQNSQ